MRFSTVSQIGLFLSESFPSVGLVTHQGDKILDLDPMAKLGSYNVCFTRDNEILNNFCFGQILFVATSQTTGQC